MATEGPRIAANWTTAAGALEGMLTYLGAPLPRHAVMGLTGHAWHFSLVSRDSVHALPEGVVDLDWVGMVGRYAACGYGFERFSGEGKEAAIGWATGHLDAGRPLIGWDFHLHEFGIVYAHDPVAEAFMVESVLTEEVGPIAHYRDWPSSLGLIELFAPTGPVDLDPIDAIGSALAFGVEALEGTVAGNPALVGYTTARGAAGFDAWADALESDEEVDRAGNAYLLGVVQNARIDGSAFLGDVAAALPELATPLEKARLSLNELAKALSPLITLFPCPTGGHGNITNPGLRQAAANPLRRAARFDREAAQHMREALEILG
ncbi:MAG TPA: hypothetical protein VFK32_00800 [Tepidiformaceae bacterium]|nr:hypothetical protein [Tepidiformaceae bacterium]